MLTTSNSTIEPSGLNRSRRPKPRFWVALLQHYRHQATRSSDRGLTLIECLVAMVIVSITVVAITPPIMLVTATRIHNRKAEQALQLAQAEIDRIRTVVERGSTAALDLPPAITGNKIESSASPNAVNEDVGMKSVSSDCNNLALVSGGNLRLGTQDLFRADVNGDCKSDFLVQTFRTTGNASGFRMGVRVYVDTPETRQNAGSGLDTKQASLTFTSGLGQTTKQPIAVLYSTIFRNDTSDALENYKSVCTTVGGC